MAYATIAELRDYLDQVAEYGRQRITISGAPTGGTFTLTYEGTATGALAYNATATAVQTALRAIVAIGANVKVTGPPGGPWAAEFAGSLATDAALMTAASSLTGGSSPSIAIAAARDQLLQRVLDRATQIIDTLLGTSFALADGANAAVVYGNGTDYLTPPAFVAGSVSAVAAPTGYTVPDYTVINGIVVVTRDDQIGSIYASEALAGRLTDPIGGWLMGVPYTVTANYGYSAVPDDIKEACLEIAVDLFRFRDAGSIKSVGNEGGGIVTGKGLPATAKAILDKRLAQLSMPGIF